MSKRAVCRVSLSLLALGVSVGTAVQAQQFGKPEPPPPAQGRSRLLTEWYGGPLFTACVATTFGPSPCAASWRLGAGPEGRDLAIVAHPGAVGNTQGPGFTPANRGTGSRTAVMGEHLTLRPANREGSSNNPIFGQSRNRGFGPPR